MEASAVVGGTWAWGSGAFSANRLGDSRSTTDTNDGGDLHLDFNASKSSSIYKSINKIQVRSCQLLIIIKS